MASHVGSTFVVTSPLEVDLVDRDGDLVGGVLLKSGDRVLVTGFESEDRTVGIFSAELQLRLKGGRDAVVHGSPLEWFGCQEPGDRGELVTHPGILQETA